MKTTFQALIAGGLLSSGSLITQPAEASVSYYDLTYTGAGIQADLFLTTESTATPGVLEVTNISGTRNGDTVLGLNSTYGGPDNEIFLNNTIVDDGGLAYDVEIGSTLVAINFFNRRNGKPYLEDNSLDNSSGFGGLSADVITQQLTLVPEVRLTTVALATLVFGWFGVTYRRRCQS